MLNVKQLLLRLVREYDPAVDLDEDSPFVTDVVTPLVSAMNHDPYATDISKFIRTRLKQELGVEIRNGSYLEDILDKGVQVILAPYRTEINRVSRRQSILNYPELTDADVEGFAANRFVIRDEGEFAQVRIRAYYTSPIDEEVQVDNLARTRTGLVYLPSSPQSITRTQMASQRDGSYYYWDILYVAAEPGESYNVEKATIVEVDGLNAVRVTNLAAARYGEYRDSNRDLMLRAGRANSQATLVSKLGIAHLLSKEFGGRLRLILSIGRNDPEMKRDVITASGTHRATLRTYTNMPTVISAGVNDSIDLATDLGNYQFTIAATTYTDVFVLADAINSSWIAAGGNSYVATPWVDGANSGIDWHSDSVSLGSPSTLQFLAEPNNAYGSFFTDPAFSSSLSTVLGTEYTGDYAGVLALSDIPGGIIDPDTINGTIIIPGNTVHVGGGAADIHIAPRTVSEQTWVNPVLEHRSPDTIKFTMDTSSGTDAVEITLLSDWNDVSVGDMVALYTGSDAGLYEVLDKYQSGNYYLRLRAPSGALSTNDSNVGWARVNPGAVEVRLYDPYRTLLRTTGCTGSVGSQLLSHPSIAWSTFGVAVGNRIDIQTGDNEGSYTITSIVSTNVLQLDRALSSTDSAMTVQVVETTTPMSMPMREISEIDEVDASGRPTGTTIPYARPIDVRVLSTFSNLNSGTKSDASSSTLVAGSTTITCSDFALSTELSPSVGDRVYIADGDNSGYYRIEEVLTTTTVRVDAEMLTSETRDISYGAPSVGSVRFLFKDPTSFEVYARQRVENLTGFESRGNTRLSYQPEVGGTVYQYEGAEFNYQRVPEKNGTYPATLSYVSSNQVQSSSHDFALEGVVVGDLLTITTGAFAGSYVITDVADDTLTVTGSSFTAFTNETFLVEATNTQGVQSTTMELQQDGPFFYFDAEFVSLGPGDAYNVSRDTKLVLDLSSDFYEEGWRLTTDDENLSFSTREKSSILFTQNYLEAGMPEKRSNRTLLQGTGIRITYSQPELVSDAQNYVLNSQNRVVCEDPLIRHLVPVFVYTGFEYEGGSSETVVRLTLKQMIENLVPEEDLSVYMVVESLRKRGATNVQMPVELIGMRWNKDRTIEIFRSEDKLETGRTSCFIVYGQSLNGVTRL